MWKQMKLPVIIGSVVLCVFLVIVGIVLITTQGELQSQPLYQQYPNLTSVLGWEGDAYTTTAYIDGTYRLRDRGNMQVTFGIDGVQEDVNWYNKEGWLPCLVSEMASTRAKYTVENFADCVEIEGNDFVVIYSRVTVENISRKPIEAPVGSALLVSLNADQAPAVIDPGQTAVYEYCVAADRFGNDYAYPKMQQLRESGDFEEHYDHMKAHWTQRAAALVQLEDLPDEKLQHAFYAGYVYAMILKTGNILHTNGIGVEEGYNNDTIGLLATLVKAGDLQHFEEYAKNLWKYEQSTSSRWKYSWVFALYLQKTGDKSLVEEYFTQIQTATRSIVYDRAENGIMKSTNTLDTDGQWTADNWSALMGLTAYTYICEQLENGAELIWATSRYEKLYESIAQVLQKTITDNRLTYLPLSMTESNDDSVHNDPHNAHWAATFLYGRWGWDGYLFGAEQKDSLVSVIDGTYKAGFEKRASFSDSAYNFGGFAHGNYSSAYNAGYASAALRGENYRDLGIKAYQFMINNTQSGPYSWCEAIGSTTSDGVWNSVNAYADEVAGSAQHDCGQATSNMVLLDSLVAQKAEGTIILGRGVPASWLKDRQRIKISNFTSNNNTRFGYELVVSGKTVTITFGEATQFPVSVQLLALKNNIQSADGCEVDTAAGTVLVPVGTTSVQIEMKTKIS